MIGPKRIETGTPEGDALGFTEDLFSGWLELYDDAISVARKTCSLCIRGSKAAMLLPQQ